MGRYADEAVIEEFERVTKDAVAVQLQTLQRILEENADCEYLQKLGLAGRTDLESFKDVVPLVTHRDLEPYVERIVEGECSMVLTCNPITKISLSSGTTGGKPKLIPFYDEVVEITQHIYEVTDAYRNRDFPLVKGKGLQLIYVSKQSRSAGGLLVTTATTHVFNIDQRMADIRSSCCSPDEVIFGLDYHQSLYCHLLCALLCSEDIEYVYAIFAYNIVQAFRTFEEAWEDLCLDIKKGELSSRITSPSIRAAMSKKLSPNPTLANSIEQKCKGLTNWYGLIPELFPNVKYVYGIMTGSMESYLSKLRHYSANLPLVSTFYGASEGWIGANVNPRSPPELVKYALLPEIAFFEFIPKGSESVHKKLELGDSTPQLKELQEPVGIGELEVGQEYEIIITTFGGFYRYKLGDVVRVVGFYNSTPELKFICRRNLMLSINIDKTTEKDLQRAVEEASKVLATEKLEVVDFTSIVERSVEPGHYVVFLETNGEANEDAVRKCCNCMDQSFVDAGYVGSRKMRAIGPLEIRMVRMGTFQKIMDHFVGLGSTIVQFKMPRCVSEDNVELLEILDGAVVGSYFSNAYG